MSTPDVMDGSQYLLGLLIALLGWCAVMFGHWVRLRVADLEDQDRERERQFEALRWAMDLASAQDPVKASAGLAALQTLAEGTAVDSRHTASALAASIAAVDRSTTPRSVA